MDIGLLLILDHLPIQRVATNQFLTLAWPNLLRLSRNARFISGKTRLHSSQLDASLALPGSTGTVQVPSGFGT